MTNRKDDSPSSGSKGGWWSRLSQYQQIIAAVVGAIVTGFFGVLIVLIGNSLGASHVGASSATGSSPSSLASPPITPGTGTRAARTTPSRGPVAADASPAAPSASFRGQYLAGLTPVSGNVDLYTGSAEVNGTNYLNSVMLDMTLGGSTSAEYNLGRQWRTLEATVGLRDDSPQKEEFELQVFADGSPIYSHLFGLGQSQHVRLNVAGVLRLELRGTLVGDLYGDAYGVWGDAHLTS